MAAPVAATIGLRGSGSEVPGFFPADTFDFRQMQEQLDFPDRVVPNWFGHGLSVPPDLGVGPGSTEALHRQSTLRPPTLHPARRKRRAGDRITTDFNLEADLASKGTQRGTPRKRALFGHACGENGSPTVDLTEAQADDDSPAWAHSSGVGLMDIVARLQREVEWLRSDPLFNRTGGGGGSAILASALAPDRFYIDESASVCGVNELGSVPYKYLMPLWSQTVGTMRPRHCSCFHI